MNQEGISVIRGIIANVQIFWGKKKKTTKKNPNQKCVWMKSQTEILAKSWAINSVWTVYAFKLYFLFKIGICI